MFIDIHVYIHSIYTHICIYMKYTKIHRVCIRIQQQIPASLPLSWAEQRYNLGQGPNTHQTVMVTKRSNLTPCDLIASRTFEHFGNCFKSEAIHNRHPRKAHSSDRPHLDRASHVVQPSPSHISIFKQPVMSNACLYPYGLQ